MANQDRAPFSHAVERDLRLDLFRGMGLWMIFLDHIPDDFVSWLTLRNYGFSDAAEFFVFISGYLAGFIYGPIVRDGHFLAATKRLVMRAWQMYVAHIMLFLLFRHRSPVRSGSSTTRCMRMNSMFIIFSSTPTC